MTITFLLFGCSNFPNRLWHTVPARLVRIRIGWKICMVLESERRKKNNNVCSCCFACFLTDSILDSMSVFACCVCRLCEAFSHSTKWMNLSDTKWEWDVGCVHACMVCTPNKCMRVCAWLWRMCICLCAVSVMFAIGDGEYRTVDSTRWRHTRWFAARIAAERQTFQFTVTLFPSEISDQYATNEHSHSTTCQFIRIERNNFLGTKIITIFIYFFSSLFQWVMLFCRFDFLNFFYFSCDVVILDRSNRIQFPWYLFISHWLEWACSAQTIFDRWRCRCCSACCVARRLGVQFPLQLMIDQIQST